MKLILGVGAISLRNRVQLLCGEGKAALPGALPRL